MNKYNKTIIEGILLFLIGFYAVHHVLATYSNPPKLEPRIQPYVQPVVQTTNEVMKIHMMVTDTLFVHRDENNVIKYCSFTQTEIDQLTKLSKIMGTQEFNKLMYKSLEIPKQEFLAMVVKIISDNKNGRLAMNNG
jgi:acetone carboxylase gamma subunit